MIENDCHLFFHCSFARAVWFSATPPLLTSSLQQEQDRIQDTWSIIIDKHTADNEFQKIMTTLWYIWKARNDARFKNAKWSVLLVHHAVAVDMRLTATDDAPAKLQQCQKNDA
jgi:hypothetical protein